METISKQKVIDFLQESFLDTTGIETSPVEIQDLASTEAEKLNSILRRIQKEFPEQVEFDFAESEDKDFTKRKKEILSLKPKQVRGKSIKIIWFPSTYIQFLTIYWFEGGLLIKDRNPWNIEGIWLIKVPS